MVDGEVEAVEADNDDGVEVEAQIVATHRPRNSSELAAAADMTTTVGEQVEEVSEKGERDYSLAVDPRRLQHDDQKMMALIQFVPDMVQVHLEILGISDAMTR